MEYPQEIIGNPVFSRITSDTREHIAGLAIEKELKKGAFLVNQGEVWPYLFLLTRGQLVAEKDSFDGRTFIAASFRPGEVFWGVSFFIDDLAMPANLKALEDSSLYLWTQRDLKPIIESNGELSWEISKLVVSRMQFVSEIIESMTFHPIAVRLARLLVGIADGAGGAPIERNLTLDDMAARIGSTREMVCRLLYKFSDEGLIKITRTEFSVTNAVSLYKRAQK
jgi:CRP-like cAMP-binding protein